MVCCFGCRWLQVAAGGSIRVLCAVCVLVVCLIHGGSLFWSVQVFGGLNQDLNPWLGWPV